MKKLLQLFLLLIFIQNISAQESKDSLTETKKSIWLGSKFHVEPIYVIDGILSDADSFRKINTEEIISVSVLKNAPGMEAFNRSNNETIIIKTKNGLTKREIRKRKREQKRIAKQHI